jgi:protein TonB
MVLHVAVGGGIAAGTLFVARKVLSSEPIEVALVVKPREKPATPEPNTPEPEEQAPPEPRERPPRRPPKPKPQRTLAEPPPEVPRAIAAAETAPIIDDVPLSEPERPGPAAPPVFGISLSPNELGTLRVPRGNTLATSPSNTGVVRGPRGRPPGGLVAPPPATPPEPPAEVEHKITRWPERLDRRVYRYPEEARQAGVEGSVPLRLFLDEAGVVTRADLVTSGVRILDEFALRHASQLRFSPARAGERDVPCEILFTFTFVLD